jgi:hypothetical protein
MRRILVKQSLKYIASAARREWRMIAKICWLPLFIYCVLRIGTNFFPRTETFYETYRFWHPALLIVRDLKGQLLGAVMLVGIFRYLRADSRFQISTLRLGGDLNTGKPKLTISYFFSLDKAVIITTAILACYQESYSYLNHYVAYYIVQYLHQTHQSGEYIKGTLLLKTWKIFFHFLGSQICLIYPYVALSSSVTAKQLWQQIAVLKNNRIRVWIIESFIIILFFGAEYSIHVCSGWLMSYTTFGDNSRDYIWSVSAVLGAIIWCLYLSYTALFEVELFRLLGSRGESN